MDMYSVIKRPIITEKTTIAKEEYGKYVFEVDRRATKIDIQHAIEKIFKVKVVDIRTFNMKGKRKRLGRIMGKRRDWKKAIVTLTPGSTMEVFEQF